MQVSSGLGINNGTGLGLRMLRPDLARFLDSVWIEMARG